MFYIGLFREKTLSFFQITPRALSIDLYKLLVLVLKGASKSRESSLYMGLDARKPVLGGVNNKGADQSAHPSGLISAFVIRVMESIIPKHATREFLIFYLVSVAEEAGLNLALT